MDKIMPIIGSTEYVSVGKYENIPAKIDTGADSSSIWASNIEITKNGVLRFALFDHGYPSYTGKTFERTDYKVAVVRSATGEEQVRYRTKFKLKIAGKTVNALLYLSDRSNNNFPLLIGRRTISGKFLVDVSKSSVPRPPKNPRTLSLNTELKEDPYKFHQKYVKMSRGYIRKGAIK
ncbi:ATP-dependent zinc protease [Candidatus Saccharibacteria bacterium]|nr:ATP-dependent zinc protease [Candidatus Saccharibacteria bacterium]